MSEKKKKLGRIIRWILRRIRDSLVILIFDEILPDILEEQGITLSPELKKKIREKLNSL